VLAALLSSALSNRPERAAIAHRDATLSAAELLTAADRLAAEIAADPGERVAIVAPNVPALVVGMLAAWRSVAVAVPLSARLRRFELERAFADSEPAIAVSVAAYGGFKLAEEIRELAKGTASLRDCLVVDELGELESRAGSGGSGGFVPRPAPPDTAAILYTSGTTGEPKGAVVPHAMAEAMGSNLPELLGEHSAAPCALPVPVSHAFGLGCLLAALCGGATAVVADVTTSLDPLLGAIQTHEARVLHSSPALLARVAQSGAELPLRTGFVAGSWCSPELLESLDQRGIRILNLYGMTEIGAAVSCRREDPPETRYRTVGRPLPGYELRVLDGEVQVRSELLPSGYHRRPWGRGELADGGWFRTGDLGELDAAGNLAIAGRAKEVVHVGGFNVFPAEVENFLLTHPAITQAAVIGVPHRALGEALQAFVVPAQDASLEPREVVRFARDGIANYKVPYDVRVVEELPLLPSGKPDRRELSRAARGEAVVR